MNYLFVVAHPDDESDAAGGTIHKLVSQGHHVAVAIMVSQAAARRNLSKPSPPTRRKHWRCWGWKRYTTRISPISK